MLPIPTTPNTTRLLTLPLPLLHQLVAWLLTDCVDANDSLGNKGPITRFHAKEKPPLEILGYLTRLTTYTPYPRDALILVLLYLDIISRIPPPPSLSLSLSPTPLFPTILREPLLPTPTPSPTPNSPPPPLFNSFTLHRLLASTLIIASRFTSDSHIQQLRAAKVAGVDLRELVRLEVEVLKSLQWRLYYSLGDIEGISGALLDLGEDRGVLERKDRPEPLTFEGPAEEGKIGVGVGWTTSSTNPDGSQYIRNDLKQCLSPQLIPSPARTPSTSPYSSGPSSPVSSEESDSDLENEKLSLDLEEIDLDEKGKGERNAGETVRRISRLSFSGKADVAVY
ncbi:hypothetical protein P7C70_g1794, partial [Phenoliferia sp. Uapishka_3]